MKISNFGEFKTFLETYQLSDISANAADFYGCVSQYAFLCTCKKNAKIQKAEECNSLYIATVTTLDPIVIFSKIQEDVIEFYHHDNFLIASYSRQ